MAIVSQLRRAPQAVLRLFYVGSSSAADLPVIDGVRAAAVMMIFVLHSWGAAGSPALYLGLPIGGARVWISEWIRHGDLGVALFFILSGFLLPQPFFRAAHGGSPRPSITSYFRKRIFRIVPAYYACIAVLLVFFVPADRAFSAAGLKELAAHLTFTHFLFLQTMSSWGIDGPMWTLTHEATFYLLVPWVAVLFVGRRSLIALPAALIISMAYLYLARDSLDFLVSFLQSTVKDEPFFTEENIRTAYLSAQFPGHIFNFALGMALGDYYVRVGMGRARRPSLPAAAGLFLGGLTMFVASVHFLEMPNPDVGAFFSHVGTPFASAGMALMLAGLTFGAPGLRQLFSAAPVRVMGIISYSAFLWHLPLIYYLARLPDISSRTGLDRMLVSMAYCMPLLLAVSIASYLLIEKPFLIAARRPRGAAPAAGGSRWSAMAAFRRGRAAAAAPMDALQAPDASAGS